MNSLKKTAVSGLIWTLSEKFLRQGVTFIVSIILARLVSPAEFGLIGMISIFMAVGYALIDSGMASSIIRTQEPDDLDYSTVFICNLAISILFYIIIYISAPYVAIFYNQPILISILRVLGLALIIFAFGTVQNAIFTKEMAFKKLMRINVPSSIVGSVVGVTLAFLGYGVWSIVWMGIAGTIMSTVQIWIVSSWRPSFRFSRQKFKQHFYFGLNLSLSSILNTVFENIYNIVIGKFYSAAQLGFFTRANSLKQLPVDNLSSALYKVTYPLFSSIQDDDQRLAKAYNKLMQQVTFWIAPLLICMAAVAEPLFRFLFTEKWLPAVPYFQIVAIGGLFNSLSSYNMNILKVKGRTDLFLKLEMVKKVIIALGILSVTQFGIYGLLYFQTAFAVVAYLINAHFAGKLIQLPITRQATFILRPLLFALLTGLICWLLDLSLRQFPDIVRLLACGFTGAAFYLSVSYFTRQAGALDFIELTWKRKQATLPS
jgi:O-antigen/teichoic acid export membrane protein